MGQAVVEALPNIPGSVIAWRILPVTTSPGGRPEIIDKVKGDLDRRYQYVSSTVFALLRPETRTHSMCSCLCLRLGFFPFFSGIIWIIHCP